MLNHCFHKKDVVSIAYAKCKTTMKKLLLLISLSILFFSCEQTKKTHDLICNVSNAEGLDLVFSINGQDFGKRQVQKVKNGQVVFQLSDTTKDFGYVESLYNLENFDNHRRLVKVFPEKKNTNVSFDIVEDSTEVDENVYTKVFSFRNPKFNTEGNNTKFKEIIYKINDIKKDAFLSYSKMDSLNKFVYPELKTKMLLEYKQNVFNNKSIDPTLKIEVLKSMLGSIPFFSKEYFTPSEKKSATLFFSEFNKEAINSSSFYEIEQLINTINENLEQLVFKDFITEDASQNQVAVSKLIEENDFTLLYFWTAGCGPCKAFNDKLPSKFDALKENKINIVHVNVDLMKKYWTKATKRDSIFWTNLYVGQDLELWNHYSINSFPTKVIFNRKKEVIDFDFHNPEDLLKLKNIN